MRFVATVVAVALTGVPAAAGLYHPLEPTPFPVSPAGIATDLGFGSQFDGPYPLLFTRWGNVANDDPRFANNPDRQAVLGRLAGEKADPAAEAADLIRLGRAAEAVNRLRPLSRGGDFRVLANLAHAHAVRGEWDEAVSLHELAAEEGPPADLAGATPDQRKWLTRVEREYYRRWLLEHRRRAATKADPATEEPLPLFPKDKPKPADAAAVVQQLLLWAPWDTALYWLLAEVYADAGRVREAATILDRIVESRQYSNRARMMAKRAALKLAVAALPPEKVDEPLLATGDPPPAADPGAFLPSKWAVGAAAAVFVGLAGVMIRLQLRRWFGKR